VAEITSASSQTLDRTRELALYAGAGVREYWLVELAARVVTVHADPTGERYGRAVAATVTQVARSTVVPGLAVGVSTLFSGLPEAE